MADNNIFATNENDDNKYNELIRLILNANADGAEASESSTQATDGGTPDGHAPTLLRYTAGERVILEAYFKLMQQFIDLMDKVPAQI